MCVCVCVCVCASGGRAEGDGDRGSEVDSALGAASQMQGLNSRTLRSWPKLRSDVQPTEPPGRPYISIFNSNSFYSVIIDYSVPGSRPESEDANTPKVYQVWVVCMCIWYRLLKQKTVSFPVLIPVSSHRTSVCSPLILHTSLVLVPILPAARDDLLLHATPTIIHVGGHVSSFKIQVERLLFFWSFRVP